MSPVFEFSLGAWRFAPGVVALAAAIAVGLVTLHTAWRAGRRLAASGLPRRWGIVGLNLLAGGAVALLLLSPRVEGLADATVSLFTEGAEVPDGESADAAPLPTGPRFTVGPGGGDALVNLPGDPLATAGQLALRQPDLQSLTVLGHGLDEAQWRTLPGDLGVRFRPPALNGPTQVQWSPRIAFGEALTVTGLLRLEAEAAVAQIELVDPAGVVVATAPARSGQTFALTTTPRGTGTLEYRLHVRRGDTLLSDDPVGVFVFAEQGARLLVVQSAPSFETRRLANWAADTGHALVIHSQISRNRDLVQGVNLDAGSPLERTASLYADTDLVLMDGRRWAGLPAGERETLLDAVRSGLGLVLLADGELDSWLETPSNDSLTGLDLLPAPARDAVWPSWPGFTPEQSLPTAPFRLAWANAQDMTRDETGALLEAWQALGEGRVMVSLLRERHRWATRGEASTFARYWTRLLRRVAREGSRPRWLAPPADARPRPAERLTLCAREGGAAFAFAPQGSDAEPETVPLVDHATGASARCGVAWPDEPGWHRARLFDEDGALQDELLLRVYGPEYWTADRFEKRRLATHARATENGAATAEARTVVRPLSPWWPWSLLLLCGGVLWLERRLFDLD